MKRYAGNTGVVENIPEPSEAIPRVRPNFRVDEDEEKPSSRSLLSGGLGGLLSKFSKLAPNFEDILLIAVLYFLYRESGDIEFLLIAGAMFII